MHLTRFTDNALRCLIVVGLSPEEVIQVPEIAERMNMSYEHLVKIVKRLAALGYVETERGRYGGVRLAIDPASLTLSTIIQETEDNLALVECFTGEEHGCPVSSVCLLATALRDARTAFFDVLAQRTLADILHPKRELVRLLR